MQLKIKWGDDGHDGKYGDGNDKYGDRFTINFVISAAYDELALYLFSVVF